jgi:hypothetical protein
MAHDQVIRTVWRLDRKRSVAIIQRGTHFSYEESGEQFDLGKAYWGPISEGGLFKSADDAEETATIEIPWLRDQILD